MRLLLVSTNTAFVSELALYLTLEGNHVARAESCNTALPLIATTKFNVVLVCLDELATGGTDVISTLQAAVNGTPVLGLHDAPCPKSFRMRPVSTDIGVMFGPSLTNAKVLSRLHAIVRRRQGYSEPIVRAGLVQLNSGVQQVMVDGTEVELTPREFSLLELLMTSTNTVLTKEAILAHLYGGVDEPPLKVVDVLVCKVRCKLAHAGAAEVIRNIYGRGYAIEGAFKEAGVPCDLISPSRLLPT